jgi:tellurite resistance protein TerC
MEVSPIFWVIFCIIIVVMLALDLGVFNKKSHEIKLKEALSWVAVWVSLAMIFNLIILFQFGKTKALEFLTAYVIEYSLSIDNIFVFIMVFSFFSVRKEYQHKVLFWGILGAVIMRAIFIFAGVALINKFHWIVIIFGVFLVFTGLKMLLQKEEAKVEPEKKRTGKAS